MFYSNSYWQDNLLVCLAGDLLKLLDFSSEGHVLLTTYGKLQPPLGKHRLKVSYLCYLVLRCDLILDFYTIILRRIAQFFLEKFVLGIHLHIHYLVPCASALKFLGNIWVTSNYSWFRKWTFLLPLMPSDFVISKICNKFINDVEPKSGC